MNTKCICKDKKTKSEILSGKQWQNRTPSVCSPDLLLLDYSNHQSTVLRKDRIHMFRFENQDSMGKPETDPPMSLPLIWNFHMFKAKSIE